MSHHRVTESNNSTTIPAFALLRHMRFVLLFLVVAGASSAWWNELPDWTGFGSNATLIKSLPNESVQYRPQKTLWDFLDLLVIPIVLGVGVSWLQRQATQRERQREQQRKQDSFLQGYFETLTRMLLEDAPKQQGQVNNGYWQPLVRAQTYTVLRSVDAQRRGAVVAFLHQAHLIAGEDRIVDLRVASLSGSTLAGVDLSGAQLQGTDFTHSNLEGAVLHGVQLAGATLRGANARRCRFNAAELTQEDRGQLSSRDQLQEVSSGITGAMGALGALPRQLDDVIRRGDLDDQLLEIEQELTQLEVGEDSLADQAVKEALSGELARKVKAAEEAVSRSRTPNDRRVRQRLQELRSKKAIVTNKLKRLDRADLSGADFSEADLRDADLRGALLIGANLSNADLRGVLLIGADLTDATLDGADLRGARICDASITDEQLRTAKSVRGAWRQGRELAAPPRTSRSGVAQPHERHTST